MRIFMALLILVCPALPAAAATTEIVVSGQGTASAAPDMATISFTINTYAASAQNAISANNARYQRLDSAMHALGVPAADVQTTSFTLDYNPAPKPPEAPSPGERYGFNAARSVDVIVHQLSLVGKSIDAAAAAGVTDVGGVQFAVSDTSAQNVAALKSAVLDARAQADALAEAAGLRIIGIRSIRQGGGIFQPQPAANVSTMMAARVPTVIRPSAVQTSTTVSIIFIAQ